MLSSHLHHTILNHGLCISEDGGTVEHPKQDLALPFEPPAYAAFTNAYFVRPAEPCTTAHSPQPMKQVVRAG